VQRTAIGRQPYSSSTILNVIVRDRLGGRDDPALSNLAQDSMIQNRRNVRERADEVQLAYSISAHGSSRTPPLVERSVSALRQSTTPTARSGTRDY
jgi:hypothetical protein